jgi:hypothetical protein
MFSELSWAGNVKGAASRPWRVLAYDSLDAGGLPREFIVKHFRSEQREARIVEYVAARFAFETEIHAIKPELVNFTPAFLEDLTSLPEPPRDIHLAEPGVHLAFGWNSRAVCLMGNHKALRSLEDPYQIGEIIGVDTVLINFDRSDQNVLFEPIADIRGHPTHVLYPIDWDMCFAGGHVSLSDLNDASLRAMQRPYTDHGASSDPMCARIQTADDFRAALQKLGAWTAAKARLKLLVQGVPREWAVTPEQASAFVEYFASRIDSTVARLQRPDDPDHSFPNFQPSLPLDAGA